MMLDEYAAWAAKVGARGYSRAPQAAELLELALGFASEVGEVAGVLTKWLRDGGPRWEPLTDELGDVAYYWARLSRFTGTEPSTLLARSRAHVEWRRAGRPEGGPAAAVGGVSLDEFTAWVLTVHGAASTDPADDQSLWAIGLALVGDAGEVEECIRKVRRGVDGSHRVLAGELGDV